MHLLPELHNNGSPPCYPQDVDFKTQLAALEELKLTPAGVTAIRKAAREVVKGTKPGRAVKYTYCETCKMFYAAQDLKNNRRCANKHKGKDPKNPYTAKPLKELPPELLPPE